MNLGVRNDGDVVLMYETLNIELVSQQSTLCLALIIRWFLCGILEVLLLGKANLFLLTK